MVLPLLAMAAPSLIGAGASLLGGIFGKKQDKKLAQSMRTNLADRFSAGTGGLRGWAGDAGAGFDLGELSSAFDNQNAFGNIASGQAMDALLRGVPSNVAQRGVALDSQPLDLGSFFQGQQGGNALAIRSLADAFGGSFDPRAIAQNQLGLLREQARPFEQQATQDFMQNLYSSGRGAVTGAAGNEGSIGGGRLAAAFGQGLGRADLDRQVQAQEMGIAGANASENLLKSAFGRFMDASQFAQDSGANAFNRQRGVLQQGYDRSIQQAGLPAELAKAFQGLAGTGISNAIELQRLGLESQGSALSTAEAGANARIGSASNIASFMSGRSSTPGLDALGTFFGGMATPQSGQAAMEMFRNVFSRGRPTVAGDGGVP